MREKPESDKTLCSGVVFKPQGRIKVFSIIKSKFRFNQEIKHNDILCIRSCSCDSKPDTSYVRVSVLLLGSMGTDVPASKMASPDWHILSVDGCV